MAVLAECEAAKITTAAAFVAFARTPADIVLLETGLGGRLDATNVIAAPLLTAITPVDMDHQGYLGETLAEIAVEIGLGEHLTLGRSESTSGGRRKQAILADTMEAVIAALYLDGGLDAARQFILKLWQTRIDAPDTAPMDDKTRLQEWAQGQGLAPPDYSVITRDGPDHAPRFTVEARLGSGETAIGAATSKKRAEQIAAGALLAQLDMVGD